MNAKDVRRVLLRGARLLRCALLGGHTGGRPLGAYYLCGRCRCVISITTGRIR